MNILLVAALKPEIGETRRWPHILFTGVGKINAAYALGKKLQTQSFDLVINVGTAGGRGRKKGEIVLCDRFVQRDMDVSALGFPVGVTPFDDQASVLTGLSVEGYVPGICSSGDSFLTRHPVLDVLENEQADVFDMEAFALASVCARENVRFACLKYITDGADDDASDDWTRTHADGAALLLDHAARVAGHVAALLPK